MRHKEREHRQREKEEKGTVKTSQATMEKDQKKRREGKWGRESGIEDKNWGGGWGGGGIFCPPRIRKTEVKFLNEP